MGQLLNFSLAAPGWSRSVAFTRGTLWALLVQGIVDAIITELNIWYLDDSSLGDRPALVLENFHVVEAKAADVGLTVNPTKCEVAFLGATPVEEAALLEEFRE